MEMRGRRVENGVKEENDARKEGEKMVNEEEEIHIKTQSAETTASIWTPASRTDGPSLCTCCVSSVCV